MQHPAAGSHAAGRDDDRRLMRRDEIGRVLRRGDDRHPRCAEDADVALGRLHVRIELVQALRVELQRPGSHRAVDVHRQRGNPLRLFEMFQPVDDLLDAADRERGHNQLAAPRHALVDDRREPRPIIVRLVQAIAVGRFDQQIIAGGRRHGIANDRLIVFAQIAGENHRAGLFVIQADGHLTRAQDVAGDTKLRRDAFGNPDLLAVVGHDLEQF